MSNVIIGRAEFSDESTITANNERSAFPGTNLQKQQVSRIWKSNGLSNVYFTVDRGFAAAWTTVALMYVNATSTATWRIRADDVEGNLSGGSATYDSGEVTFWAESDMESWALRHGLLHLTSAQTTRFIRIDLYDTDNASDLTAGRLLVGNFWQPTINMEYPLQYGPEDDARLERSQGGALFADQRDAYNKATIRLNFLDEDEMLNNAFDLRRHGKADDLLVVLNPASTSHLAKQMVYGLVTRNQPIVHPAFNVYSHVITIAEMATIARLDPTQPPPEYATEWDGTNDGASYSGGPTGLSATEDGITFSFFYKTNAVAFHGIVGTPSSSNLYIVIRNNGFSNFIVKDSAGGIILSYVNVGPSNLDDGNIHHIIMSFGRTANRVQLVIDGTTYVNTTYPTANDIAALGGDMDIAILGGFEFDGVWWEWWFDNTSYDVVTNLTVWRNPDGTPADLGADGSAPGAQPIIYYPDGNPADNKGTGGNATISGAPTQILRPTS